MSNLDLSYYVQEVALQCGHARRAWSEIRGAVAADDVARAYYHLQAYLAAVSLLSLILWPKSAKEEERRGRDLRFGLQVRDDSPLRDRGMRNHFLHFEQRLEAFLAEPREGFRLYEDLNMHADDAPLPPRQRLRHFDPLTMTLTVRGDRYALRPVHQAIVELSAQTRRNWWQNVLPPGNSPAPDDDLLGAPRFEVHS